MRIRTIILLAISATCAWAQSDDDLFENLRMQTMSSTRERGAPALDPKRIINESSSFLKEKEPEMTAEEYALYEKAQTMLASNPAFAVRLLEAMMNEKEKPSPAFEFILGNAYYAAGETEKSEARYRGAVDRFPSFLRAWNNLGVLYYTAGRWNDAVGAFSKSIALGDRDPTTYGLLAYSLEQVGNDIAAEVTYMQALSGAPTNADWQEGLLRISIKGHQFVRAESIVRTLLAARPKESRYWLILANILISAGRKGEAVTVLETAAGAGVANPDELIVLGDLYAERGMHSEAIAIYAKLLKPAPETGEDKLLRFADSLAAVGRTKEASATLAALPAQLSARENTRRLLIKAQIESGAEDWTAARRTLESVLADEPLNGRALLALGRIDVVQGDDAHAGFTFDSASRIPESAYRAHLELANLELRQRQYSRSVTHLEAALKIERSDAVADYLAKVRALAGEGEASGQ